MVSVTPRLNLFFKNDVFLDTILLVSTGLTAFICANAKLSALFKPSSLIKT